MTRLSTLAIALAATATPVALSQPPAPAPTTPPPPKYTSGHPFPVAPPPEINLQSQHALAAIAAQQLARAALIDLRAVNDPGPVEAQYAARLLRDASALDPSNTAILRLAIDAAGMAGDQQATLDLSKALVAADPDDTAAQLDMIDARIALCQNVEDRLKILESLLGPRGDSLDPSIRSRLAVESALLRRERGDGPGFVKDLTNATTLDSSNYAAAALALDYYSTRVKDPQGRFELLASTLLASPIDATIHAAIAHELAAAGATEQSLRFYDNAKKLYNRHGDYLPIDGTVEQFIQLWKSQGPQVVVKPLNDAIETERRKAQEEIDLAAATGKPGDKLPLPTSFRHPIAIERLRLAAAFSAGDKSTIDRSLADYRASIDAMVAGDPAKATSDAEYVYVKALTGSGDISSDVARIRAAREVPPETIARLEAWRKHRTGDKAGARTAFESMKGDPLAQLALAVIEIESSPAPDSAQSHALNDRLAALANTNPASPVSAWAYTAYQSRNNGQGPAPSQNAEKFTAMGAGIPSWLDDISKEPSRLIAFHIEPAKSGGLEPLEPALLNVRISNNTPVPVAIGPGLTIDDRLLISTNVDIGGQRIADLGRSEVSSIGGRLRIMPREEVVFTVWADPGAGGWAVQNLINKSARLQFSVIQGFVINEQPKPGPFGTKLEAGPIGRASLPLTDPVRLASEIGTLQDDEFAEAILHARLHLLSREKPLTPEQAKALVAAIGERYKRGNSAERIAILTLTPTPRMVGVVMDLEQVVAKVDETDPAVARAALLTRVDALASPILAKYKTFKDPGVQAAIKVIEARIASDKFMFAKIAPNAAKPPAPPSSGGGQPAPAGSPAAPGTSTTPAPGATPPGGSLPPPIATPPVGTPPAAAARCAYTEVTDQPSTPSGGNGGAVASSFASLRKTVLPWLQIAGIAMLVVAVYLVVRQRELLDNAWTSLKAAPAWQIGAVVTLPLANWLIVTLLFYTLVRHSVKVRLGEMTALIGSAWLLNIVPGRPGLMGRVAYHTIVNQMPVKDSVKVIVVGIVANAFAVGLALLLVGASFLGSQMLPQELVADATPKFLIMGAAVTLALLLSMAWYLRTGRQMIKAPIAGWRFVFAVAMRYADYLVWVFRYWLAFKVIGLPITLTEAAGIAVVSQIVQLSPVQLGPREWAVGIAGAFLPSLKQTAATASVSRTATGLTADLLNRAAELAVQLPVGIVCTWWVFRELRKAGHRSGPSVG